MISDEVEAVLWAGAALALHVRINMDDQQCDMEREMIEAWERARDAVLKAAP